MMIKIGKLYKDKVLLCPECKGISIHIYRIRVATGKGLTTIDENGTKISKRKDVIELAEYNRGNVIELALFCEECQSASYVTLSFHKGQTFVDKVGIPETWKEIEASEECNAIWRD